MSIFLAGNCKGLTYMSRLTHEAFDNDTIAVYFRLFILLYADDSVVLAESPTDMQASLDSLGKYCNTWSLTVNSSKTKVVVFSNSRLHQNWTFFFKGNPLETVKDYTYLGVVFKSNGKFTANIDTIILRSEKALFQLNQKIRKLSLPPKVAFKLFDSTVLPIMLYACECWGDTNVKKLENIHMKFCKNILKLRKSTTNVMVYGETGRYPIDIVIKKRCVSFWHKLTTTKHTHLSGTLLELASNLHRNNKLIYPWLDFIKNVLIECGIPFIYDHPNNVKTAQLGQIIETTLKDLYISEWNLCVNSKVSCLNYKIYKQALCFEPYLSCLPSYLAKVFCKFRCRNFKLPVLLHSFDNSHSKYCSLCGNNFIGDEFHFLLECIERFPPSAKFTCLIILQNM